MDKNTIAEIKIEISAAELMVKDLERLYKSYAKKALIAKQEREKKQDKRGFLEFETKDELQTAYGYDEIDNETYYRGLDYFDNYKPIDTSAVELHRNNIKKLVNLWKGTIKELNEELNPPEKNQAENVFERREREEREQRNFNMNLSDLFGERQ